MLDPVGAWLASDSNLKDAIAGKPCSYKRRDLKDAIAGKPYSYKRRNLKDAIAGKPCSYKSASASNGH
ncbi:hypothetical protein [Pseudomonas sp. GL-B-19]|uniref:hypothetical protein n=1 Tax=Pseudomonas sp. GL-B-19 TaxID=2832393 RepID=UPI001CBCA16C|nr:hypothetical protein [Pseudomonas sp. GL-B-19]